MNHFNVKETLASLPLPSFVAMLGRSFPVSLFPSPLFYTEYRLPYLLYSLLSCESTFISAKITPNGHDTDVGYFSIDPLTDLHLDTQTQLRSASPSSSPPPLPPPSPPQPSAAGETRNPRIRFHSRDGRTDGATDPTTTTAHTMARPVASSLPLPSSLPRSSCTLLSRSPQPQPNPLPLGNAVFFYKGGRDPDDERIWHGETNILHLLM